MHIHSLDTWRHDHIFTAGSEQKNERRVHLVIALTIVTMVAEIASGWYFGSMALLADGWHMSTHAMALSITAFAYYYARKHARDRKFTFGTGKVGVLGGYTSGILLGLVALAMIWESVDRIINPVAIRYQEAMIVAAVGLGVNLLSAWLLHDGDHDHGHDHQHNHAHDHAHHSHGHDHNIHAAFMHVMADALTSVLAIVALSCGMHFGWNWMDPVIGIVGALVIAQWTRNLLRDSGKVLLDAGDHQTTREAIRTIVESDADNRLVDLHVWQVGPHHKAAIVSLVTHFPKPVEHYKALLASHRELAHVTVEVNQCTSEPCIKD